MILYFFRFTSKARAIMTNVLLVILIFWNNAKDCQSFRKYRLQHNVMRQTECINASEKHRNHTLWSCQNVCEAITFLLDDIFIRFDTKLFR